MALGFFDGASTPEQLARRRAELDFLASGMGRAQNVGQGAGDILRGIGVGLGRYRANKTENAGIEGATKAWSAFNPFGPSQPPAPAPQVSGGAAFPNPATATPSPAPKQSYGGFNGIPPSQSVSGENLARPASGSSFLAALDRNEGGGSYDTLFGHAQKNGPFAGTRVSGMSIGDAINFSNPNGAYANSVKGQIGRVATPMGRYQIVGTTLRNAAKEMGLDPSTPFNQQTQDAIAMHLAKKRVMSAGSMGGKINALRQEWHGFNNVPDSQMAQIVNEIQNGGGQPVQMASNDPQSSFAMPASAPPNDMAQAQPIPKPMQPPPQQVAQAQPQGADSSKLQQLWELSQNQFLNPNQQAMAKMLLEQEMQKQDPAYQMKMQQNSIDLETGKLQLDQLKNPKAKVEHVGNSLVKINPNNTVERIYTDETGRQRRTQIATINGQEVLTDMDTGEAIKVLGKSPAKQDSAPQGHRFTPDGKSLERIPGYRDTNLEMDMRKEFDTQTKDFRAVRDSYNRIQSSAENPTPAGDLSLIFNYMKMLDPGSVVRESEFAVASNAAPLLTRYGLDPEKLKGIWAGQKLTPEQRADFLTRAEQLYGEQDQTFQSLADQYSDTAKRNGLNPDNIILTPRQNPRKKKSANDGWQDMGNGIKIRKKQ